VHYGAKKKVVRKNAEMNRQVPRRHDTGARDAEQGGGQVKNSGNQTPELREIGALDWMRVVIYPCSTFLALFARRRSSLHAAVLRRPSTAATKWWLAAYPAVGRHRPGSNWPKSPAYVAHCARERVGEQGKAREGEEGEKERKGKKRGPEGEKEREKKRENE
jgi:hypothetical protein